nr:MAG TPA: hypothetical protein [Caudoviricetes sp.]
MRFRKTPKSPKIRYQTATSYMHRHALIVAFLMFIQ